MRIVTRQEWGARYEDGFGALKPPAAEVWLHHTGGNEPDSPSGIRQLEQVGQDRFGGGVSYTFLVGQSGTVYEGTGANREGAHTFGHNTIGRGICWIGNYEITTPTDQIIQATAELLAYGRSSGWWSRAMLTGGHRDVVNTACPGKNAYTVMGEVNRRAAILASGVASPQSIGDESVSVIQLPRTVTPPDGAPLASWWPAREGSLDKGVFREEVVHLGFVRGWHGRHVLRFTVSHPGGHLARAHVDYPFIETDKGQQKGPHVRDWVKSPGFPVLPPYKADVEYIFEPLDKGPAILMITYAAPGGASLSIERER